LSLIQAFLDFAMSTTVSARERIPYHPYIVVQKFRCTGFLPILTKGSDYVSSFLATLGIKNTGNALIM
jgi:hypothetical protein